MNQCTAFIKRDRTSSEDGSEYPDDGLGQYPIEHDRIEKHETLDRVYKSMLEDEPFWKQDREPRFRTLGLNWKDQKLSYYVGAVWVSHDPLIVLAARPKSTSLDVAGMFLQCCALPATAGKVFPIDPNPRRGHWPAFFVWPDAPLIATGSPNDPSNPLGSFQEQLDPILAMAFLSALYRFCQRHLRRQFIHVSENLQGRAKGRILVGAHVRQNIARLHPERVVCRFLTSSIDILPNRILRAALHVAARCLSSLPQEAWAIRQWLLACQSSLAEVELVRIEPYHWRGLVLSGAMTPYRPVIRLAKALLSRYLVRADGGIEPQQKIPPFSINMSRLFELYAYAGFRKGGWAGDEQRTFGPHRPDAILEHINYDDGPIIIDFKYKYGGMPNAEDRNEDRRQIIEYASSRSIQKVNGKPKRRCLFVYPDLSKAESKGNAKIDVEQVQRAFIEHANDKYWWYGDLYSDETVPNRNCLIGSMRIPVPILAPSPVGAGSAI